MRSIVIKLEQTGVWRKPARGRSRPKGEGAIRTRPVRIETADGDLLARVHALPLRTGSVDRISCSDVLEYVRNDEALINEIARVMAPSGELRLRVPATGSLAGFDHLNLMHYLVDTSRRGARPRETYEVGWRRHYGVADLAQMLGDERFEIVSARRYRFVVAELTAFAGSVLFRWLSPSHDRYRRARRIADAIERIEDRLRLPFGFVLEIRAIRLSEGESAP